MRKSCNTCAKLILLAVVCFVSITAAAQVSISGLQGFPILPYVPVPDLFQLPPGDNFVEPSGIAGNSQGHIYMFRRKIDLNMRPPALLFGLVLVSAAAWGQEKTPSAVNPFLELRGKTILVITPHSDDDIIGSGGALAFLSGHQNHLIVVFLTAGEKGTFDPSAQSETIGRTRMQEAAAAYRTLGFPDADLIWFGYPDGELDFAPLREIRIRLTEIIRRRRPEVAFALDPGATYYRYHYRDHRTAALVSADAIGAAMWPLEYPELGPAYRVPEVYYFYTAEPTLKLDITGVHERKLAALAQHRSQFPPAVNHYTGEGPPPARSDLEATLQQMTGSTTLEQFRRR